MWQKKVEQWFLRLSFLAALLGTLPFSVYAQAEIQYTLSDLYKLRKDSRNKKETIQLNNRISNFYTNNKLYTKKNIDSAFFFANQALLASSDDVSGSDYGLSQITLAKVWLKMSMPQYVLKNIRPVREDVKIKLLIETAKFYLYKPKEEKNDLDSAMFLLNKAYGAAELNSMPKLANLAEIY
ncbi:MAG: hypothetical protein EOP55_06620, partial [Sphingobacteriales bacterium]